MSFAERLFGVGDVTLDTDRGYEGLPLDSVPNPGAVAREVSRTANATAVGVSGGAEGGPTDAEPAGDDDPSDASGTDGTGAAERE